MQWTLEDLEFLRLAGVKIDAEVFEAARRYENTHRDFVPCDCGAKSFEQHQAICQRASILCSPGWFEQS